MMFVSEGTRGETQTERVRRAGEGFGTFNVVWVLVGGEMKTAPSRTKLAMLWTHRIVLFADIIFLSSILLPLDAAIFYFLF
jgi:hypothetical protein